MVFDSTTTFLPSETPQYYLNLGPRTYISDQLWGEHQGKLGHVSSVAVDQNDRVYIVQRTDPPILVFNPEGVLLSSWGDGSYGDMHGITASYRGENRILIAARDSHKILVADDAGNLQLSLGDRSMPRYGYPFNHPTSAHVDESGEIFVSDGYANAQIHRFDREGKLIKSWGTSGGGRGEFITPHSVIVTRDGRVVVTDRDNNRVQVFSREGEFLDEWGDLVRPMDLFESKDGDIYVTEQAPRISCFSANGNLLGRARPFASMTHGIAGDSQGNLYLAELPPARGITKLSLVTEG